MLSFNAYKSFPKHRFPCIPQTVTRYTSAFTNFKMSSTFLLEPGATEKGNFVSKYLGIFQIAFNDWFLVRSLVRENALYGWLLLHLRRLVLSSRMWAWWVSHARLRRAPVLLLGGALVHEHQVSHAAWRHCPRLLRLHSFHIYSSTGCWHRSTASPTETAVGVCPFEDITVCYLNLEAVIKGTHIQHVMCSWRADPFYRCDTSFLFWETLLVLKSNLPTQTFQVHICTVPLFPTFSLNLSTLYIYCEWHFTLLHLVWQPPTKRLLSSLQAVHIRRACPYRWVYLHPLLSWVSWLHFVLFSVFIQTQEFSDDSIFFFLRLVRCTSLLFLVAAR